jgi:two-component system, NarL family, captular synthesis response regulator RcsB
MNRVAIFDDHPAVIDALVRYFVDIKEIDVVGQFTEMSSLLSFLENQPVDFLISDVLTDEEIGLTVFETLAAKYKDTKVIAYTSIKSDFVHNELKSLGVIAVVNKKEKPEVILDFILKCEVAPKKTNQFNSYSLTPKEREIAKYLAQGLAAKEIAHFTKTSIHTINNQKNSLLEKFDCDNTTGLVMKLTQLGLIDVI